MDRQHRRELKHDKFVDEIGVLSTAAKENQRILITIGLVAVVAALLAYGIYFYRSNRERKAQDLLATAMSTVDSPLQTPAQPNPQAKFKTDAERNAAAETQFKQVKANYGGTKAAEVADLYLARIAAARNDTATAKNLLADFIRDHPESLLVQSARYSLYQMRIDGGEAPQVASEINAEMTKKDPILPQDSLLVLLAHSYEVQGDEAKTRDTYKRLVTEYPDSPFALEAQRRVGAA